MSVIELDKSFTNSVASYGTIQIRVVVLRPKPTESDGSVPEPAPTEPVEDTPIVEPGASPLSAYLERKAHGKQCLVFLINGQRHDAWDNSFIVRDLGFKYLRTRTMIIVDLDGLTHEAISEIVQGSRQGLYQGDVLAAIQARMVATLKKDPDLTRLQTEAEQEISELQAGDEAVRQKLNELIEAHHTAATQVHAGAVEAGQIGSPDHLAFGQEKKQDVVIRSLPSIGEGATPPLLVATPTSATIRLEPDTERRLLLRTQPGTEWANLENLEVRTQPGIGELQVSVSRIGDGAEVRLIFAEPEDFDTDEYPLVTSLHAFAKFKGYPELRLLDREIIINRVTPRKRRPTPPLSANPTFLRVVSRQPIKLIPGGPSAHVRLQWDGDDSLTAGATPPWRFRARCLSLGSFPPVGFSEPKGGRFELLLDTPHGLLAKQTLEFEVEAIGPAGRRLATMFVGEVAEAPPEAGPRRVPTRAPEATAQRRPPYELKYIREADWETSTCWNATTWTKEDVGALTEPTDSTPLTLLINEDAEDLKAFREALVRRNLDEATVRERVTRYTAHVAFHLYQMYRFVKDRRDAQTEDPEIRIPDEDELRLEIKRVATTLLKLMEVSFR